MRYYLRHKDILLAQVEYRGRFEIEEVFVRSKVFPMLQGNILDEWISHRKTLLSRENAIDLYKLADIRDMKAFVDVTYCLSVEDCLWLCSDYNIKWDSVSLYRNSFNRVFTDIARGRQGFRGTVIRTPSPELSILGSSLKWLKKYNNSIYLYKSFGGLAELEYSGCYAEYFAGQLCKVLGVSHTDYDLVKVDDKICSCCKLFTSDSEHLIHIAELCDDAIHLEEHIKHYTGVLQKQFRDLLIVDCLLFNVDRHDENIALVYDDSFKIVSLSPAYDFDHSLFYDLGLLGGRTDAEIAYKINAYAPKTYVCHSFKEQFKFCIYKEMYGKLVSLYNSGFIFKNHPKFPLNSERLSKINELFRWNLKRLLQ